MRESSRRQSGAEEFNDKHQPIIGETVFFLSAASLHPWGRTQSKLSRFLLVVVQCSSSQYLLHLFGCWLALTAGHWTAADANKRKKIIMISPFHFCESRTTARVCTEFTRHSPRVLSTLLP